MNGVEEIEEAIDSLPPEDFRRLAQWLRDRENERMSIAYRGMSLDSERERGALEWSEGLIGDVAADLPNASR